VQIIELGSVGGEEFHQRRQAGWCQSTLTAQHDNADLGVAKWSKHLDRRTTPQRVRHEIERSARDPGACEHRRPDGVAVIEREARYQLVPPAAAWPGHDAPRSLIAKSDQYVLVELGNRLWRRTLLEVARRGAHHPRAAEPDLLQMSRKVGNRSGPQRQIDTVVGKIDDLVRRTDVDSNAGMQTGDLGHQWCEDVPREPNSCSDTHDADVADVGGMCGGVLERLRGMNSFASRAEQRLSFVGER
jgi:hypothetical protein